MFHNITWKYLEMFPFVSVPRCCFAVYPSNFLLLQVTFHIPPSYNNDQSNFLARSGQVAHVVWVSPHGAGQSHSLHSSRWTNRLYVTNVNVSSSIHPKTKLAEYILQKQIWHNRCRHVWAVFLELLLDFYAKKPNTEETHKHSVI